MTKVTKTTVTASQIQAWKNQHGSDCVWRYKTRDGLVAYFKSPDRKIISCSTAESGNDKMKFRELLVNNCWLGGDEQIRTVDKYFLGLTSRILALVEVVEGKLEKI